MQNPGVTLRLSCLGDRQSQVAAPARNDRELRQIGVPISPTEKIDAAEPTAPAARQNATA
jgi:hypothetical protein